MAVSEVRLRFARWSDYEGAQVQGMNERGWDHALIDLQDIE